MSNPDYKCLLLIQHDTYLWFEASPYKGMGYNKELAEGGQRTTENHVAFVSTEQKYGL